ncbi:MAG: hypothetical protein KatS3mg088_200 [Patescibacteria group bacterium]|nr:MAG: hypothetical protein KatS3mg088_200 [Patescibacteria group bacterium]
MLTIGNFIKKERIEKKLSLESLERKTKIKKEFIYALEREDWQSLPEFPVVLGFVKNIAKALNVNENKAAAFLRRDYPPKIVSLTPKTPIGKKSFVWSPRSTLLAGIILAVLVVVSFLGYQAYRFLSPPSLVLFSPKDGDKVRVGELLVSGKTDVDAIVFVNNQPVVIDSDGNFQAQILVDQNTNQLVVKARSRSGKERVVEQRLEVED